MRDEAVDPVSDTPDTPDTPAELPEMPAPVEGLAITADLAPEPHPRQRRRNVVGLVALFLGGMPNVVLAMAWAGMPIGGRLVGEIIAWAALLAVPIGLLAAILSWTKVFRFRDWWFGILAIVLGVGFFFLLAWILSGIELGFPEG